MSKRYHYVGDVNPENGGYLVSTEGVKWGYADVVRIQPCSDAGGPDNCFWIERLTVNLRTEGQTLENVLSCCGQSIGTLPKQKGQRANVLIDCHIAYGAYDQESSELVRIGAPDPFFSDREGNDWTPGKVLRGNASVLRYARSIAE